MNNYPEVNISLFNTKAWISQYPDPDKVKNPDRMYPKRPEPWPAASAKHMGVDLFGIGSAPKVYVPKTADGVVVEANPDRSDGKYGWWATSGYYVAVQVSGTIGCEVVWTVKHLASIAVAVGDKVGVGQVVGTEGRTGNAKGLHVHCDLFVDGIRWDPTPYFLDKRSFKLKMEETPMELSVLASFKATDNINIREEPSANSRLVGLVNKGNTIAATAISTDDKHIWARHDRGYCALGTLDGTHVWAEPVRDGIADLKAEIQTLSNRLEETRSMLNVYTDRIKKIAALAKT